MDTLDFLTPADPAFPKKAREDRADAHLLLRNAETVLGRCSLWWKETPRHENRAIGAIGHYEATSGGKELLTHALRILREVGAQLAVGPLNGNTWRTYRFITEAGTEPPFFLEPHQAPGGLEDFLTFGFHPLAEYFSGLCCDLSISDPRLPRAEARLADLTIRPLELADFEKDLGAIFAVSAAGFVDNFLYTPISEDEFVAQYLPLRDLIDPRLVLIAERQNRPVGYVFGVPNLAQKPIDTVILKTVACLPGRPLAGLGTLLVGKLHEAARKLGYKRVIHALMHESNNSRNISGIYTKTMRRYTLFAREL